MKRTRMGALGHHTIRFTIGATTPQGVVPIAPAFLDRPYVVLRLGCVSGNAEVTEPTASRIAVSPCNCSPGLTSSFPGFPFTADYPSQSPDLSPSRSPIPAAIRFSASGRDPVAFSRQMSPAFLPGNQSVDYASDVGVSFYAVPAA